MTTSHVKTSPFESLARLAQAVTSSLTLSEVLDRAARAATDLLPDAAARIWVVEGDHLVLSAEAGIHGPPRSGRKTVFAFGEGLTGIVAATRQPLVVEDLLVDSRAVNVEWMRREGYVSLVSIPLVVRDQLAGVLSLVTRHQHRFSPNEMELLTSFGSQAAIAIENARLFEEAQQRRQAAERLGEVARLLSQSLDPSEVGQRIVDSIRSLLGARSAFLFRVEPASGDWRVVALSGEVGSGFARNQVYPRDVGATGLALHEGRPVTTLDVLNDPRIVFTPEVRATVEQAPYRAVLALPLLIQDRRTGVLVVGDRAGRVFSGEEIRLAQAFADQAVTALENARLFGDSTARQARLEALLEVSRELSRIQPVDSLLERIAEACGHLLDSDMVGIRVLEGDELVVRATWGTGKDLVPTTRLKIGESLTGIVAATGESLLVTDPSHDPRLLPAHREAYRRLGVQAFLGVPVKVGDRLEGVLTVRTRRPEGYSAEDLAVATAFASQAATALENARLYQQAQHAYEELKQTQDQLTQAQKMEAVGRLAGGIAHDFNNLLMVVMGRTQLMLRRLQAEDPLSRDLDLINTTMKRAADLTRQLLAFSRKQVLQPKVLDLNAVVTNIDPMLRRLIGEHIEAVMVLDPALGPVKADPAQLEQVILNLAVNARDAMPQGGRLTIETANVELDTAYARRRPGASPGPHVMLAVSDTGCGMDAETQARLFEPFFTTKGAGKGTGLGLSTVYGIVKQSGGNICVYSEPGRGTTFKIYLPRVEETVEREGVQPGPEVAQPPKPSETVLLVEDEDGVRELVRDILQENGYSVLEARDGAEALQLSGRHPGPIHLLLTDVVMPQISGRALADQLVPRRPEMKVLYMSGYTENAVVHHGVLDQGTAFLQKPVTAEALAQKVRQVLEMAPRARERAIGLQLRTPNQEFRIEVMPSNEAMVVAPTGALDMASAAMMKRALQALLEAGRTKLVVDLSGLTYIDSAGLGELVRGMKAARELGGDLRLCGLPDKVLQIFELTRLDQQVSVYPARENAVASWG